MGGASRADRDRLLVGPRKLGQRHTWRFARWSDRIEKRKWKPRSTHVGKGSIQRVAYLVAAGAESIARPPRDLQHRTMIASSRKARVGEC
jgi:hypothetical protein